MTVTHGLDQSDTIMTFQLHLVVLHDYVILLINSIGSQRCIRYETLAVVERLIKQFFRLEFFALSTLVKECVTEVICFDVSNMIYI